MFNQPSRLGQSVRDSAVFRESWLSGGELDMHAMGVAELCSAELQTAQKRTPIE